MKLSRIKRPWHSRRTALSLSLWLRIEGPLWLYTQTWLLPHILIINFNLRLLPLSQSQQAMTFWNGLFHVTKWGPPLCHLLWNIQKPRACCAGPSQGTWTRTLSSTERERIGAPYSPCSTCSGTKLPVLWHPSQLHCAHNYFTRAITTAQTRECLQGLSLADHRVAHVKTNPRVYSAHWPSKMHFISSSISVAKLIYNSIVHKKFKIQILCHT